jgi:hypothetical protein
MLNLSKIPLTLSKSTKGTHVYGNEEKGLSFYFPKELFTDKNNPPQEVLISVETP